MVSEQRKPEEILDVNRRWLPPEPAVWKVIEAIEKDSAHIEKRGHHEPPLLVFEDGGVIELPKVRYRETHRGMQLISEEDVSDSGVTRHRDVCGTVDEIEGILRDDPASVQADPHRFDQLLDNALYMIERMSKREDEYREFLAEIAGLCARPPRGPDPKMASKAADEIRMLLHEHPEDVSRYVELLNALAEDVRHVASNQERCLREHKALAMKINRLYENVKGARNWDEDQ